MEREPGFHIVTATITIKVKMRLPDERSAEDFVDNIAYDLYDDVEGDTLKDTELISTNIESDEMERG
jgi:hypothetical protein